MLVLSRHANESIVIPELKIRITVTQIRGAKARIGVDCPPEFAVHREEVWEAIKDRLTPITSPATTSPEIPNV